MNTTKLDLDAELEEVKEELREARRNLWRLWAEMQEAKEDVEQVFGELVEQLEEASYIMAQSRREVARMKAGE